MKESSTIRVSEPHCANRLLDAATPKKKSDCWCFFPRGVFNEQQYICMLVIKGSLT